MRRTFMDVKIGLIVACMMFATTAWSGLFWVFLMPRFARKQITGLLAIGFGILFGAGLIAIPAIAYFFLPERTLMLGGLLVIAWCLAVRASAWFAARKYFVPMLKQGPQE